MIEQIIEYVVENPFQLIAVALAVIKLAEEVAKITPTQKDDKFIEKARKVVEWVGKVGLPNLVKTKKGIKRK